MGGHGSDPLGWTVLALVVVAYAHVILELAAAGLALAIAARIMNAAPWQVLIDRVTSSHDGRGRRGREAVGAAGARSAASASGREVDPSARKD
jgi:hypothetical protein